MCDHNEPTGPEFTASKDAAGSQFLTFTLSGEYYGVDILRVQEIRGWENVTRVPNAPSYVKGVINLRGAIVPIYDLRQRFDITPTPYTKQTVVIVIRGHRGSAERSVGVVVDAVADVLAIESKDITKTPDFGSEVPTESIRGLVTVASSMVVLIDVDRLLDDDAGEHSFGI